MPTVSVLSDEKENQAFEIRLEEVIFDALDNQGTKLPHGCLAGSCGSCKIEVLEGAEHLKSASLIEQNTIDTISESLAEERGSEFLKGKTIRLSCRARLISEGNLTIKPI